MDIYKSLLKCKQCNHLFICIRNTNNSYQCSYNYKNGRSKCNNNLIVSESFLTNMIKEQLQIINMQIKNVDIKSVVDKIIVSKNTIEILYKNLPISTSYYNTQDKIFHFDNLND